MKKKKATKSKAAKSVRDLPAKKLNAKTAMSVKGGDIPIPYGKIKFEYKP